MINVRNKHSIHGASHDCSPAIVSLGGLLSQNHLVVPISCLKIGIVHRSLRGSGRGGGTEHPPFQLKVTKEKQSFNFNHQIKQFGGLTQVQPYITLKSQH